MAKKENTAGNGAPPGRVRIRSYRHGLGDCHLLRFTKQDGTLCHVLIDCGVIENAPKRAAIMQKVATDIATETGGVLDMLVVTHRHTDHLCGFDDAQDVFKKIATKELWLGWTEDPANEFATSIHQKVERRLAAVRAATSKLDPADKETAAAVSGCLEFFGGSNGAFPSTAGILAALKNPQETQIGYYSPGSWYFLRDVPNVRVYILGPRWDPTPLIAYGLNGFVDALHPEGSSNPELSYPFQKWHRREFEAMKQSNFFKENYFNNDNDWRRIDTEWLACSWNLITELNDFINNTSLALAFEFVDTKQVLLFPGDAQAWAWTSWGDLSWNVWDANGQASQVRPADLISRVVFYKASHHASYQGALTGNWGWALDNMTDVNLCCLVPVDRAMTKKIGLERALPSKLMIESINQRTRGRTLLTDPDATAPKPDELKLLSAMEQKNFASQIKVTDDYIDYTLW
jgi:hypothetical protein